MTDPASGFGLRNPTMSGASTLSKLEPMTAGACESLVEDEPNTGMYCHAKEHGLFAGLIPRLLPPKRQPHARSRRDRKQVEMLFAHLKRILRPASN
jgi:hypothetical protein